ncbi:MAG: hypothetical protein IJB97_00540 [Clostridia bacterium]|nr:hypothetical protein [Clostridia bacterium]
MGNGRLMWAFQGKYTGEVKSVLRAKQKKTFKILFWGVSIFLLIMLIVPAVMLDGDLGEKLGAIAIIDGFVLVMGAILLAIIFVYYRRDPKCDVKITNDGFYVQSSAGNYAFAFYNIKEIEYGDGFIAVSPQVNQKIFLQKELLVQGDWEELQAFLKKVEESLGTDDPIYQVAEPETEYFTATVKNKRIYERFVTGVSMATPVGRFEYFVTFAIGGGEGIEYQTSREWFEKLEENQTGVLTVLNGGFFSFENFNGETGGFEDETVVIYSDEDGV